MASTRYLSGGFVDACVDAFASKVRSAVPQYTNALLMLTRFVLLCHAGLVPQARSTSLASLVHGHGLSVVAPVC